MRAISMNKPGVAKPDVSVLFSILVRILLPLTKQWEKRAGKFCFYCKYIIKYINILLTIQKYRWLLLAIYVQLLLPM
jgi:hypothetical protein